MPTLKLRRDKLRTGLDIGSSFAKYVQLSGTKEKPVLKRFGMVRVNGHNRSDFKRILSEIAEKISVRDVNISISGPDVVVRYVDMPKMTAEELRSSIKFEANKYIPFSVKDVILDCQPVEETGRGKMRTLVVAAKKDAIDKRLSLIEGTGLSAKIIDCDSFALVNAFLLNFPEVDKGVDIALINIGERSTTLDILKGRTPCFTRELEIGGSDFAKAISQRFAINIKAAALLKEKPGSRLPQVLDAIRPVLNDMIEEIRLSMNYYEDHLGSAVDKAYICGGVSGVKGLIDIFQTNLEIECAAWDPFKRIKIDKGVPKDILKTAKRQLAVAVGLAMRS